MKCQQISSGGKNNMNAKLIYFIDADAHCVIAYSIESGPFACVFGGSEAVVSYTNTAASPVVTSFATGLNDGDEAIISVANTDDNTKVYQTTITNNSGVITTVDIGITTTISLVTP